MASALGGYPEAQNVSFGGEEWVIRSPHGIAPDQLQKAVQLYNDHMEAMEAAAQYIQLDFPQGAPGDRAITVVHVEDRPEIRKSHEIMAAMEALGNYSVERKN
jgi:hypothetical protein